MLQHMISISRLLSDIQKVMQGLRFLEISCDDADADRFTDDADHNEDGVTRVPFSSYPIFLTILFSSCGFLREEVG